MALSYSGGMNIYGPFEAGFTSLAHSDADIEATIQAFRDSFAAIA